MKYGYYNIGKSIPHRNTFTDGANILVVRSPTSYISTTIRLEDSGWEVRDCVKILLKDKPLQIGLLRNPFKGKVANNVLTNGCGGINIDICRINPGEVKPHNKGRFPANLLLDLSSANVMDSQSGDSSRFFFNFTSAEQMEEYLINLIKC